MRLLCCRLKISSELAIWRRAEITESGKKRRVFKDDIVYTKRSLKFVRGSAGISGRGRGGSLGNKLVNLKHEWHVTAFFWTLPLMEFSVLQCKYLFIERHAAYQSKSKENILEISREGRRLD